MGATLTGDSRVRRLLRGLVVALALSAAACGGSSGDGGGGGAEAPATVAEVLVAVEGLDAEAREAKLLELAQAEGGTLTWYTTKAEDQYPVVVDAFTEAYGIEVTVLRGKSAELVSRITEEADGNAPGPDVVSFGSEYAVRLSDGDLLAPYSSPYQARLPDSAVGEVWSGYDASLTVPTWNTELVGADEVPRRWEDLADPRWKGLLAIDPGEIDWYLSLWTYLVEQQGMSEAEADDLFERIAANTVFLKGHTAQAQLLAAGEFELGVNTTSIINLMAADGAPVAWKPAVEPVVADISAIAVLRRAPHPATAVLFVDWSLSDDGQAVLAELSDLGVAGLADLGLDYVLLDATEVAAQFDEWSARFEQLARLGEVREVEG
jgi:iron(III) transport system substrate-binding protein